MKSTYDDAGRKIEEFYVDNKGNLVDSEKGYAKITHAYDDNTGYETETRYFNAAGDPVMVSGASRIEYEYDSAGNKTVTKKYNTEDQLIVDDDVEHPQCQGSQQHPPAMSSLKVRATNQRQHNARHGCDHEPHPRHQRQGTTRGNPVAPCEWIGAETARKTKDQHMQVVGQHEQ